MNGQFDFGDIKPTQYFLSIAVVLGLLFAFTSGDTDEPMLLVFLRWQLQTVVPMLLLIGSHSLLLQYTRLSHLNPWLTLLLSGLLGALLFTPIALAIDVYLEKDSSGAGFTSQLLGEWLSITPPISLSWIALNVPWVLGYRVEKVSEQTKAAQAVSLENMEPPNAAFMDLIPVEKRGEILFLKSELHYLLVVTDKGNSLILYNLGDAVSELPPESGLSVHRSYWVAFAAVETLVKKGRQGELKIINGRTVPVSRNNLRRVDTAINEYLASNG